MKKNEIDSKIEQIDKLLINDDILEKYINTIENNEFESPSDLSSKILKNLNSGKKRDAKILHKPRKITYLDILKVAACTVFALIMWHSLSFKSVAYASSNVDVKKNEIYNKIDNVMQSINEFFMKPMDINFERRNK